MMLTDFNAILLTLKLALVSTLVLLVLGTPLAWWLARSRWRYRFLVDAAVALPLVLPPTVLGFYLLLAFGSGGLVGLPTLTLTAFTSTCFAGGPEIVAGSWLLPGVGCLEELLLATVTSGLLAGASASGGLMLATFSSSSGSFKC